MQFNHLRVFHAVATSGSFSRAAERLFLTQPAVSQQVHELEKELGSVLFERLGRRIYLTDAGRVLLSYTERILFLLQETHEAMQTLCGTVTGELRLGASTTIGTYILPAMISRFQETYPQSHPILEIAHTMQLEQALVQNRLDLALVEGLITRAELQVIAWMTDELCLIVPPGHSWQHCCGIAARELLNQRFLAREPGSGTRRIIEERLRDHGVVLTPTMELGGTEALKQAVMAGLGIAIVSQHTIQRELTGRLVYAVPIQDVDLRRPLSLVYHRDKHHTPLLTAFLSFLQAGTADAVPAQPQ